MATLDTEIQAGASAARSRRPAGWRLILAWLPHLILVGVLATGFTWAWQNTIFGFPGMYNDDASYICFAQALAQGKGYIIPWAPVPVPADRFPIGFPAFLSLFFKVVPPPLTRQITAMQISVNVLGAAFLLVAYLFIVRRLKISPWFALIAVTLVALDPMYSDLGATTMSDLPFALVFVAAWWLQHRYLERPSAGRLLPVAVTIAAAILVRYAAAILPLVAVVVLLWRRRWQAALSYGAAVALLLAPWVAWVLAHHSYGYASQWAHTGASAVVLSLSLGFSALYVVYLGLAPFLFPGVFLADHPWRTPIQYTNPAYISLGLLAAGFIAFGLWWAGKRGRLEIDGSGAEKVSSASGLRVERRLAAASICAYLVLIWAWSAGFLNLGEYLYVRLLMPVLPVGLALTLTAVVEATRGWRLPWRSVSLLTLGSLLALGAAGALPQHEFTIHQGLAMRQGDSRGLAELFKGFAREVPPDELAATQYEPIFHLLVNRPSLTVLLNPSVMLDEIAHTQIRYLLMGPSMVGGKDLTLKMVQQLNRAVPGLIEIVRTSTGRPTGVFRIDRSRLARPTERTGPEAKRRPAPVR